MLALCGARNAPPEVVELTRKMQILTFSPAASWAGRYWPSGFVAGQSSSRLYHWPGPPRGWRIDVCHV